MDPVPGTTAEHIDMDAFRRDIEHLKSTDSDIHLPEVNPDALTEYDAETWSRYSTGAMSVSEFNQRRATAVSHIKERDSRVMFYAYLGNELADREATRVMLDMFRDEARVAMGEDEHAKRMNFSELTDQDRQLFKEYTDGALSAERIKQAVADAHDSGHFSSAYFRGWLANQLTIQLMRKEMKSVR